MSGRDKRRTTVQGGQSGPPHQRGGQAEKVTSWHRGVVAAWGTVGRAWEWG